MNEKFFDLKQEKQARMVNAALKIFALKGYQHASTDDIVKEAGISKGLLFHYFDSKLGTYSFIYDFSSRYIALELSSAIDPGETSYFEIRRQMEAAKMQVMKSYPFMFYFLNTTEMETVTEAILETEESKKSYEAAYDTIYSKVDFSLVTKNPIAEDLLKMLDYTLRGNMQNALYENAFNAEMNYEESVKYINLVEKLLTVT